MCAVFFFFSSRRRHTRLQGDWSSDVCSSDLSSLHPGPKMDEPLDPKRTVAELKELRQLTADDNGAQRVAFTKTWVATRAWLQRKLGALPVEIHTDEAGNLWTTLAGRSDRALLIGGHMDSVPNGGWLDGCLNVLAGVE